jgi:hypothetical protein
LKLNYLGIIAGIVAFVSLFLPWFTIELWTRNLSNTMNFVAGLYQLTGTVEGVVKSMFLVLWFNSGAFIFMLIAGLLSFAAGISIKKHRVMIFLGSCALVLIAMGIFGYGLINSNFAVEEINPGYTISQFPEGSFGLSADESMLYSYDYSWTIGIGFWLALASAVLTLLAALMSKKDLKHS